MHTYFCESHASDPYYKNPIFSDVIIAKNMSFGTIWSLEIGLRLNNDFNLFLYSI